MLVVIQLSAFTNTGQRFVNNKYSSTLTNDLVERVLSFITDMEGAKDTKLTVKMILRHMSKVWFVFFLLVMVLNIVQSVSESETKIEDRYLGEMEHLEPGPGLELEH